MEQVLCVIDSVGDEHLFVNDDDSDFLYRYGIDAEGNHTNEHELQIIKLPRADEGQRHTVSFFRPRYLKIWWE